jgi:xanthine dehydrogenase YagS FAD-binding subunit
MKPFTVLRPDTAAAALAAGALPGAKFVGGGTNLVDLMKLGVEAPAVLVDLASLPTDSVDVGADGSVNIGATVRNSDLAVHDGVRRVAPVLSQAILSGASGQIRNMATVGGNLLQRTRCPYFQDISKPCNKRRPGSGCPAVQGERLNLAVLSTSERCVATHPSDMAVALVALEGEVIIQDFEGEHLIPIDRFYVLPEVDPSRETVLPAGALITAVRVPASRTAVRSAYRKARERASFAFAVGSVAAALDVVDDVVVDVRLAFGGVAPIPWRARTAERVLRGEPLAPERIRQALAAEFSASRPLPGNAYKVDLVSAMAERLLVELGSGGVRESRRQR